MEVSGGGEMKRKGMWWRRVDGFFFMIGILGEGRECVHYVKEIPICYVGTYSGTR